MVQRLRAPAAARRAASPPRAAQRDTRQLRRTASGPHCQSQRSAHMNTSSSIVQWRNSCNTFKQRSRQYFVTNDIN